MFTPTFMITVSFTLVSCPKGKLIKRTEPLSFQCPLHASKIFFLTQEFGTFLNCSVCRRIEHIYTTSRFFTYLGNSKSLKKMHVQYLFCCSLQTTEKKSLIFWASRIGTRRFSLVMHTKMHRDSHVNGPLTFWRRNYFFNFSTLCV